MAEVRLAHEMQLPASVYRLSEAFKSSGFKLFVVGGAVRDAVMGTEPKDFDLATDATPEQVVKVVIGMLDWKTDEVGASFGVVRARMRQFNAVWEEHEIATFRKDVGSGRRPEAVEFTTIEEDVKRRDLTINALFYDIDHKEVVDMVGGLIDIEAKVIRTVGRPQERFAEDRLRILRTIRFAARLGFRLDLETSNAIKDDNNLVGVSTERIRDEFVRSIASARSPLELFDMYDEYGMWGRLFPTLMVSRKRPSSRIVSLVLSSLLGHYDQNKLAKELNGLKYSDVEVRQVCFFVRFKELSPETASSLRRAFFACHLKREAIEEWHALNCGTATESVLRKVFLEYLHQVPVSGDDLLDEGYSGPALGKELNRREAELFVRLVEEAK